MKNDKTLHDNGAKCHNIESYDPGVYRYRMSLSSDEEKKEGKRNKRW